MKLKMFLYNLFAGLIMTVLATELLLTQRLDASDREILRTRWIKERQALQKKLQKYDGRVWIVSFSPVQIVLESDYAAFDIHDNVVHGFRLTLNVPSEYPMNPKAEPVIECEPKLLYPHIWVRGVYCLHLPEGIKDGSGYKMAHWLDMAVRMARWDEEVVPAVHRANNSIPSDEQAKRRKMLDKEDQKTGRRTPVASEGRRVQVKRGKAPRADNPRRRRVESQISGPGRTSGPRIKR